MERNGIPENTGGVGKSSLIPDTTKLGEQDLTERYTASSKLRGLLKERNNSILAHGLDPVEENVYNKLVAEVETLLRHAVPNMKQLLTRAIMIKL